MIRGLCFNLFGDNYSYVVVVVVGCCGIVVEEDIFGLVGCSFGVVVGCSCCFCCCSNCL